jgi:hypothetical protein
MARKTKGYLLFPRAEHDLESIYDYTVEHWSWRQAKVSNYGDQLRIMVTGYELQKYVVSGYSTRLMTRSSSPSAV